MKKSRRYALVVLLLLAGVAACTRPDNGPSPFAELQRSTKAAQLPTGPQPGPEFEIIPDAELVYGPGLVDFSISDFASLNLPELDAYSEEVDEHLLTGTQILEKVARDYSVNPRLLLALLRERSGGAINLMDPFIQDETYQGLFKQLSWAANQLNRGFYTRRVGALHQITLADGAIIMLSDQINAATASLQAVAGLMLGYAEWQVAVGPLGIAAAYLDWFGSPQLYALDPLIPLNLTQPTLLLPYTQGEGWYFTSGPHAAWGDGAAWAALDFAPEQPDEDAYGCYESPAWVRAVAAGRVVRVSDGLVVQDLDEDGFEGTGWSILYMHVAAQDRVELGAVLNAGDAIGHPSCEGGPATGTHLHIARRYNGEWIPADQNLPFILDGWESAGFGVEYDGSLSKDGIEIQASGFPTDENKIY